MNKALQNPIFYYGTFFLLFIFFCFHVPDSGYDKYFWISWAKDISEKGLNQVYLNPEANGHPLYMYLLKAFSFFFRGDNINENTINYFKCFIIFFDFATLALLIHIMKENGKNLLLIFLVLLNPAFWYNTIVWGQYDSVHTFFILVSLYMATLRNPIASALTFVIAFNVKFAAIVFLPVLLYLNFSYIKDLKAWGITLFSACFLQIVILIPFVMGGKLALTLQALSGSSLDFYPFLSRNAYNLWHLLFEDPFRISDTISFEGLRFKTWGLILFSAFYVLSFILYRFAQKSHPAFKNVFLFFALISIGFFFFPTQMHERYVHPAILFSALYGIFSGRFYILILCSIAYLLNLEAVMQMLRYYDDEMMGFVVRYESWFVFKPSYIALLYLFSACLAFYDLFQFSGLMLKTEDHK